MTKKSAMTSNCVNKTSIYLFSIVFAIPCEFDQFCYMYLLE